MSPPQAVDACVMAVLAPLRFVARDNFERLERVVDLPETLARGLTRISEACTEPAQKKWAQSLIAMLPKQSDARPQRVQALGRLLAALQAWPENKISPSPVAQAASQPQPVATPKAMVPSAAAPKKATAQKPLAQVRTPHLNTPLAALAGVGPKAADQLASRDLHTVEDLLHFLPRRYQGRSGYQALGELTAGMVASVEGQISAVSDRFVRGKRTLEVVIIDATGSLHLVWFRVPGRGFVEQFRRGHRLRAAGNVKKFRAAVQMVHPEVVHVADSGLEATVHVGDNLGQACDDAVIPLYLDVDGLHARSLRRIVQQALPALCEVTDPLPANLRAKRSLVDLGIALQNLHAPPSDVPIMDLQESRTPWHRRLIYDELLFLQLGLLWRRQQNKDQEKGLVMPLTTPIAELAAELLPFAPTAAQARVMVEIATDLARPQPMHRLLQGDVGSGKTAVALTAAYAAHRAGFQTALMAPTELLAEQHARTAATLYAPLGVNVRLLTGNTPKSLRRQILAELKAGEVHVLVGTHALIQADISFHALGLAVIDEQHRFGVLQRARLTALGKASTRLAPHMLVMTATPIPRTLALTVYGDLDVSIIDALPPGRSPIVTSLHKDGDRQIVYAEIRAAVAAGHQAYVVFPLVEDSDKEGMGEIRAAVQSAEELAAGPLKDVRLGLLHGRLSGEEKEAVMRAFARKDVDVLVATTVIEVGIDVPNATVMVIEHAERFGLSQLHQLRGRVGRGAAQSKCLLLARARPSEDAWRRLDIMVQSQDGFRIAEEDLAIRGPGDFIGTRQSGLPVLTMANLARDGNVLAMAREDARDLLAGDPSLSHSDHAPLQHALTGVWAGKLNLLQVG